MSPPLYVISCVCVCTSASAFAPRERCGQRFYYYFQYVSHMQSYNNNILHYYAFRSCGIVFAISYIVNENLYCRLAATAAEAMMASGRRHPLRRGPRNASDDGTRNVVVITTITNTHRLYIIYVCVYKYFMCRRTRRFSYYSGILRLPTKTGVLLLLPSLSLNDVVK